MFRRRMAQREMIEAEKKDTHLWDFAKWLKVRSELFVCAGESQIPNKQARRPQDRNFGGILRLSRFHNNRFLGWMDTKQSQNKTRQ